MLVQIPTAGNDAGHRLRRGLVNPPVERIDPGLPAVPDRASSRDEEQRQAEGENP
jgi:hypothetical protein